MTKSLRKRHRQIWLAGAVLLPAGIIFAWLAIPNPSPVKLLQSPSQDVLPVIIKSKDANDYRINIRGNEEYTAWQAEWKNKTALMVPSAVIYKIPDGKFFANFKPGQAELIGRIEARGDYIFPLKTDSAGLQHLQFILYDFIHEKIIDTITF